MPHKDPTARNEYSRGWKRRNRARLAPRQKAVDAARHANERAARYGSPGRITADQAAAVLARGMCHYCGAPQSLGIDHVKPLAQGGPNTAANLVPACHSCNASKWRQDRPGRWSRQHDQCVSCGTSDVQHWCHGRCKRCYSRERSARERAQFGSARRSRPGAAA